MNDELITQAQRLVDRLFERSNDIQGDYYTEQHAMTAAERRYLSRLNNVTQRAIDRLVRRGGDDDH